MRHRLRYFRLAALAWTLCLPPGYASLVTLSASGSFTDGATLSGSVTIDTTTGVALSGDLRVSGIPEDFTVLKNQSTAPQPSPIVTELDFTSSLAPNNVLGLLFEPHSLIGYAGGPLCRFTSPNCINPNNANSFFVTFYGTDPGGIITDTAVLASGALTPAVPEPSSLALMSAALLPLLWTKRRMLREPLRPLFLKTRRKPAMPSMHFRCTGLVLLSAALPALASEAHFGLLGIASFETARMIAYCDGSVTPTPCDITFEFHDLSGRTLKESSMILQPGSSGFLDFTGPAAMISANRLEIDPCFKILRGTAQPSLEVFDNFFHRTRLLISWGEGAAPRSNGEFEFGSLSVTQFDITRMGAFCAADGSVEPLPCDVTLEFHDSAGRTLKASHLRLAPGAGGFLDLRLSDIASGAGRVLITPCFDVAAGAAVLDIETIDAFSGLTIAQAYPAAVVPAVR